jgi:hemolysin III
VATPPPFLDAGPAGAAGVGLGETGRAGVPSYLWPRPRYRGLLHAVGAVAVVPFGAFLLMAADGSRARVAAAVYVIAQLTVFTTSAGYHLLASTPTARRRMQLADHSMIYLLIAGTWAPVCLLVLPDDSGAAFLVGMLVTAAIGISLKLFGVHRFPRTSNSLYLVMGWAAVLAMPAIVDRIEPAALLLMGLGGLAYSAGAVVLWRKRPDPRPKVFGYHEIWHGFTVVAAACHFTMVWMVVA